MGRCGLFLLESWWWPLTITWWGTWRYDFRQRDKGLLFLELYESAVAQSLGDIGAVVCYFYAGLFASVFSVLSRRSLGCVEMAYFACGGPPGTPVDELVRVAGARWAVEECFELAKGECGLDEYEVRSWVGWHRHVTLSLWALAVVAVIRSRVPAPRRKKGASD